MSENKPEAKKPKVLRIFTQFPVHLGADVKNSLSAGDLNGQFERMPTGVVFRYEIQTPKGKAKKTGYIPDSNIAIMDLDETP